MSKQKLLVNLTRLGINDAIADKNATVNDQPAILLRWNGQEHYYTGFGSNPGDPVEIETDLVNRFGDS